ncbi:MAG: hypothetical protein ACE5K1_08180 [Acidiferrobacterales bacterium]
MKQLCTATFFSIFLLVSATTSADPFNCANHIAAAEAAIERAAHAMHELPEGKRALPHTLVDDAKMLLHSAKHNYEKPAAGGYDLARAAAKADAARGFAEAAEVLSKAIQ